MKKYNGIVYKYTNKINGKAYIGQTMNEVLRKIDHKGAGGHGLFHSAVKKYGYNNFNYEVLYEISGDKGEVKKALDNAEQYFIGYYDTTNKDKGYNVELGGKNSGSMYRIECTETGEMFNLKSLSEFANMTYSCVYQRLIVNYTDGLIGDYHYRLVNNKNRNKKIRVGYSNYDV